MAPFLTAILILQVCTSLQFFHQVSGIFAPQHTPLKKRAQVPCPVSCFCAHAVVRCTKWPSVEAALPAGTRSLVLEGAPRNASLRGLFTGMDNVQWMRVGPGLLEEMPLLPTMRRLQSLDLSGNRLRILSEGAAAAAPSLSSLDLSNNRLQSAHPNSLKGLDALRTLKLNLNVELESLPAEIFLPTPAIKDLDISGTRLNPGGPWASALMRLRKLNASRCFLETLMQLRLPSLRYLDLSHNPLTALPPLSTMPALESLVASHSGVSYLRAETTKGCSSRLARLDLSHSNLSSLNTGILAYCIGLEDINLSGSERLKRLESHSLQGLINLSHLDVSDCPVLYDIGDDAFSGLDSLRELSLAGSGVVVLPRSLADLSNTTVVHLAYISLLCDCHSAPAINLLRQPPSSWRGIDRLHCIEKPTRFGTQIDVRSGTQIADHVDTLGCSPAVVSIEPRVLVDWGKDAILNCNVTGTPQPEIIWLTSNGKVLAYNTSVTNRPRIWVRHHLSNVLNQTKGTMEDDSLEYEVLSTGELVVYNVTRRGDFGTLPGLYKCFAWNPVSNASAVVLLGINDGPFRALIIESAIFGGACAVLFLLTTWIVQFMRYIIERIFLRMGWECCCCKNRLSPKAKQIRQLIESVEGYKTVQLDKLKENYNYQVLNIKEGCYQQMERLRDSYSQQTQNLRDLCDYSTQQIGGVRDQYLEQVKQVRDYSTSQMNRVRENYVFQRTRVRKFSGHQLLRLRETYKYQQKTLNKLLENLPDLYIQTCRTATCQRTDSVLFDEIDGLDIYYKVDFITDPQSATSSYYTPTSTLSRATKAARGGLGTPAPVHSRRPSTASEYHEARCWPAVVTTTPDNIRKKLNEGHCRSMSIAVPLALPLRLDISHKRSASASSHPSPRNMRSTPPLLEEISSELPVSVHKSTKKTSTDPNIQTKGLIEAAVEQLRRQTPDEEPTTALETSL